MSETPPIPATPLPPAQGWTNRRLAVRFVLVVTALCSALLAGAAIWRDVGWPHTGALGVSLAAMIVVLGGYLREARGEQADYLKRVSEHAEALARAFRTARGDS